MQLVYLHGSRIGICYERTVQELSRHSSSDAHYTAFKGIPFTPFTRMKRCVTLSSGTASFSSPCSSSLSQSDNAASWPSVPRLTFASVARFLASKSTGFSAERTSRFVSASVYSSTASDSIFRTRSSQTQPSCAYFTVLLTSSRWLT